MPGRQIARCRVCRVSGCGIHGSPCGCSGGLGPRPHGRAEVEYERRNGYRWYFDRPAKWLNADYPEWLHKRRP